LEYLPFLYIFTYFAGLAAVFALARRWRRLMLALVGTLVLVGAVLLGWAASQGIWAEPGKVHAASPAAEMAFRIGGPLASIGTAVFLMALPLPDPRWDIRHGPVKSFVADIAVRMIGTFILSGVTFCIVFTVVTGYIK
jgi:hypothetical protein